MVGRPLEGWEGHCNGGKATVMVGRNITSLKGETTARWRYQSRIKTAALINGEYILIRQMTGTS